MAKAQIILGELGGGGSHLTFDFVESKNKLTTADTYTFTEKGCYVVFASSRAITSASLDVRISVTTTGTVVDSDSNKSILPYDAVIYIISANSGDTVNISSNGQQYSYTIAYMGSKVPTVEHSAVVSDTSTTYTTPTDDTKMYVVYVNGEGINGYTCTASNSGWSIIESVTNMKNCATLLGGTIQATAGGSNWGMGVILAVSADT